MALSCIPVNTSAAIAAAPMASATAIAAPAQRRRPESRGSPGSWAPSSPRGAAWDWGGANGLTSSAMNSHIVALPRRPSNLADAYVEHPSAFRERLPVYTDARDHRAKVRSRGWLAPSRELSAGCPSTMTDVLSLLVLVLNRHLGHLHVTTVNPKILLV